MANYLLFGIALVLIAVYIINRKKFKFQRRISTTVFSIGVILILYYIAPMIGINPGNIQEDMFWIVGPIIVTSLISDFIYKEWRG